MCSYYWQFLTYFKICCTYNVYKVYLGNFDQISALDRFQICFYTDAIYRYRWLVFGEFGGSRTTVLGSLKFFDRKTTEKLLLDRLDHLHFYILTGMIVTKDKIAVRCKGMEISREAMLIEWKLNIIKILCKLRKALCRSYN